ncbi:MAG TPA: phosphoribosyltransferase family protein [Candidatus Bathyarchaeia archaeon]|nr:phosphoribosyltransferase family protein [Candidatus Bathyarchaeia archaeon]
MEFFDRASAGKELASDLKQYQDSGTVALALPRGGVVVGAEVAKALNLPLGLILVRKIGHPGNPEYVIGAVAEGEEPVYNELEAKSVDRAWLKLEEEAADELIERRHEQYFDSGFMQPEVAGKNLIIVDDGIATGLTMLAAIKWARSHRATRVIVAAPVVAPDVLNELALAADEVCIIDDPAHFRGAVGAHYKIFDQVDDLQVRQLLLGVSHYKN